MATLLNKLNREVKVIIPNMREFHVFFSDNEGSVMFFKRDWEEESTKENPQWKPSDEQIEEITMKKSLKLKKGEMLYQWVQRLSVALNMTEGQSEAMQEVSKTSYIHGSQDAQRWFTNNRNEL